MHLLAEPWDCGMYQVGTFPNWDTWGEWNGKFRDDLRYAPVLPCNIPAHCRTCHWAENIVLLVMAQGMLDAGSSSRAMSA